ncbi:MAG: trypsin-like peptidase domain-containing protein [Thermoplasmata archaeon]|nr:trypsin-like peptidase domain-containing protein [Thermoplasmata archaeon]
MKNQINPNLAFNQMLYSTLKIYCGGGTGTGFIFTINVKNTIIPLLITNKHVVEHKEKNTITVILHLTDENGNEDNCKVTAECDWYFHSSKDLCFTFFSNIVEKAHKQTGKKVNYIAIGEDLIPNQDTLNNLSSVEEIVMVGYPIGLWDSVHNYPLFRHGYTSTHPAIGFEGDDIGLIDIAALPGSSGSPIFIRDSGMSKQKGIIEYRDRLYLMGIQYATILEDVTGELIVEDVPTKSNYRIKGKNPTNIGYYVRSSCLLEFKDTIKEMLEKRPNNQENGFNSG